MTQLSTLTDCHFLPGTSFWPFHELSECCSLFPSSSVSWLSVFVCWDGEFSTHSSAGLSLADFFSFFSQLRAATEEKVKVKSSRLILLFLRHIWVWLSAEVWENASYIRFLSLRPSRFARETWYHEIDNSYIPNIYSLSFKVKMVHGAGTCPTT